MRSSTRSIASDKSTSSVRSIAASLSLSLTLHEYVFMDLFTICDFLNVSGMSVMASTRSIIAGRSSRKTVTASARSIGEKSAIEMTRRTTCLYGLELFPTEKCLPVGRSLVFQSAPDSIAEVPPYIVVAGDVQINLYRKKTGICAQSISLAKGRVSPCIVANDDWAGGGIVAVAAPYEVICFHKVSAEEQIKDLLRKKYFKEAICLVEELESEGEMTKEMMSFVHAQVGFLLLFYLHFEDAVNHFLL